MWKQNKATDSVQTNPQNFNLIKNNCKQQQLKARKNLIADEQFQQRLTKQNNYLIQIFDQKLNKLEVKDIWRKQQKLNQEVNATYTGQYKYSKQKKVMYGLGKLECSNGSIYLGEWFDDSKQGNGIQIDQFGNRYEGQFKNNVRKGFGIQKYINGDKFIGQWRQGLKHGQGTQYYALTKQTYKGNFIKNHRQGKGKFIFRSGDLYKGNWINDKRQGSGIIIFYNGDVFKGNWKMDSIQGVCSLNYKNGDYFIGYYSQGIRKGQGKYIFASGDKIQGEWYGNHECIGKMTYINGDFYEGDIYKGERNGKGIYYYQNGNIYSGNWRQNQKFGFGKLFELQKKDSQRRLNDKRFINQQYQYKELVKISQFQGQDDETKQKIGESQILNFECKTPKTIKMIKIPSHP